MLAITALHLHLFAIIAPPPEVQWLSDYVVAREMPLHVAALIAIVTLFTITWTVLSGSSRKRPSPSGAAASH